MSHLVSVQYFHLRVFLLVLALALLASLAVACGGSKPKGLLAQVPDGYGQVERWDLKDLLQGQGLEALQEQFLGEWDWIEVYGIVLDDVTELVKATSEDGDYLYLLAGQFDWEDIQATLEDADFTDSTYLDVEIWQDDYEEYVLALMEKRRQVAWGYGYTGENMVRDVLRVLDRGTGFLFEEPDSDMSRALGRVEEGFMVTVVDECWLNISGCQAGAISARRGEEKGFIAMDWVFLFRSDSSAESGRDDIEDFVDENMPPEMEVEEVVQDGEFVVVRTTMNEEDIASISSF